MKALNAKEIDTLAGTMQYLVGSRLQEAIVSKQECGLGFWTDQGLIWLWIDLDPSLPWIASVRTTPRRSLKPDRPLLLFLRSHFVGQILLNLERDEEVGRQLRLTFSYAKEPAPTLEIRLWPHGQNLIALAQGRHVAFSRPQKIVATHEEFENTESPRNAEQLMAVWQSKYKSTPVQSKKADDRGQAERKKAKAIAKTEQAIGKVKAEIDLKESHLWLKVGHWLTSHQSLDAPNEYLTYIDKRRSLPWNIENAFHKGKENQRKIEGTRSRLQKLQADLEHLNSMQDPLREMVQKTQPERKSERSSRHRTMHLESGLRACVGRSAKDNLELLRAARAWDYWLHLKDFPGSHGFIYRDRDQKVSDKEIRQVGNWLVEATFGARAKGMSGERIALLIVECRFVRPIRGDRLGRVTHTGARSLNFKYQI